MHHIELDVRRWESFRAGVRACLRGAAPFLSVPRPSLLFRVPEGVTRGGSQTCRGGNEISLLQVGNNLAPFFFFFCFCFSEELQKQLVEQVELRKKLEREFQHLKGRKKGSKVALTVIFWILIPVCILWMWGEQVLLC